MRYLFVLLILGGCSTTTEFKDVKVPVAVIAKPADVTRPVLTSDKVTAGEFSTFVRALEVDLTLMKKYATDLEKVIAVYKEEVK